MRPTPPKTACTDDLFRSRLDNIINLRHELVKLSEAIDWQYLEERNAEFYSEEGRPGVNSRVMIGLHILKFMYNLSDDNVCDRWVNDPYFQYFCGEIFFQHEFPIERSSMTHWRNRVGEKFCESLVQESLMTAHKLGALKSKDAARVIVDTTVQPKAITFPTDAKLRHKAIQHLARLAKKCDIQLRQSYVRVSKSELIKVGRYRHAKQMKRANKAERKLKTYLGRIIRDIRRKIGKDETLKKCFAESLGKAQKILDQRKQDNDKLYSWHAPEVECIGKGKADKPYEFGCKVSIMTNLHPAPAGHFVLHTQALHGRPYDGHTLKPVIEDMQTQTGLTINRTYVDDGYRGHGCSQFRVYRTRQKRGITPIIKRELKRRAAIEPIIGHLKQDSRLGRNYLKGQAGDKMNALFCAAGYNFRLILRWLRKIFWLIFMALFGLQNFFRNQQNFVKKWAF